MIVFLQKSLGHFVGVLARLTWPWPLHRILIRTFVWFYQIRQDEMEHPLTEYPNLNAFFTRKLRPHVRPKGLHEPLHPADAHLISQGLITSDLTLCIKGQTYCLSDFSLSSSLPKDANFSRLQAGAFEQGHFGLYYLGPSDYHRVHAPVTGCVRESFRVPGYLWPVNAWARKHIPHLFAINERLSVFIETTLGDVIVIFIGALNVGSISLSLPSLPAKIQAGDELGVFHMGSAVLVLYPKSYQITGLPLGPTQVRASTCAS